MPDVSDDDLALILEALEDAASYRDARSRVLDSAVRRQERRGSPPASSGTAAMHMDKARAYAALATQLKKQQGRRPEPPPPQAAP